MVNNKDVPEIQFIFSNILDNNYEGDTDEYDMVNRRQHASEKFYHVVRIVDDQSGIVCRKWTRYEKMKGTQDE